MFSTQNLSLAWRDLNFSELSLGDPAVGHPVNGSYLKGPRAGKELFITFMCMLAHLTAWLDHSPPNIVGGEQHARELDTFEMKHVP